jgi:hypothetical protein
MRFGSTVLRNENYRKSSILLYSKTKEWAALATAEQQLADLPARPGDRTAVSGRAYCPTQLV